MSNGDEGKGVTLTAAPPPTKETKRWLSWQNLRDMAIIALICVVAVKLAITPWILNIDRFSFTDLLALVLAIFSVWLSVMFYFKADEGSKRFYNDSYEFTRDISVILGRIEERFGERLTSLSDHYGGLREDLSKKLAVAVVEERKGEVNQAEAAVISLAGEIAKQDGLGEAERNEFLERLRARDAELQTAQKALLDAQEALRVSGVSPSNVRADRALKEIAACLKGKRYRMNGQPLFLTQMMDSPLRAAASEFIQALRPDETLALVDRGWLANRDGKLSPDGLQALRAELLSTNESPSS